MSATCLDRSLMSEEKVSEMLLVSVLIHAMMQQLTLAEGQFLLTQFACSFLLKLFVLLFSGRQPGKSETERVGNEIKIL